MKVPLAFREQVDKIGAKILAGDTDRVTAADLLERWVGVDAYSLRNARPTTRSRTCSTHNPRVCTGSVQPDTEQRSGFFSVTAGPPLRRSGQRF